MKIPVNPATRVRDAEQLAQDLGCDLVLDNGRAYLTPREPEPDQPPPRRPDDGRSPHP